MTRRTEYLGIKVQALRNNRLSLDEAWERAHALLRDGRHFRCTPASEPFNRRGLRLPADVLALFIQYDAIASVSGHLRLARSLVQRSALKATLMRLGPINAAVEVAVHPDQEVIYELPAPRNQTTSRRSVRSSFTSSSSTPRRRIGTTR
jgi:hypothetical protein